MASSSRLSNYGVFLSFRGEDTRKTFVDHLYTALVQQGIYTYKDEETLPRGESIGPSLLKAIEESKIAVIVFSKNYADSSWCLDELAYIMKCKDTRGQIVMPIFYHVDPSEVRKNKRRYGEAFAKQDSENNNKVELWRKALMDASKISGWEPKQVANGCEARCIKEIVDTISHRLRPVINSEDKNLIGIEDRVQDLKSKLKIGSGGVVMLGIWGVGGGGKTTLASSVYDEIYSSFDGCCFVENIREESTSKNGLKELQEKILTDVLKQKQMGIGRVEEGRLMIKSRLCHRNVLIVLDDVSHLDHLEALAGKHDWFGEGSRIIITTRDEHLLIAHTVNVIHNVSLLNDDEAIKLFHKHAYRDNRPIEGYEQLAKYVISYANGLPLALKVLGSFLCDKNMNEWKSALARLKEIPHNDIFAKLKISFDGLQPDEQQLFLDIACFFRGESKESLNILDACGFHSVIGVKVLIQKALITINLDGEFDMHDLVQEMGHYIVRGEHPKNPEKHTRIWQKEDVLKICSMDATTDFDKIEAIRFSFPDPLPFHPRVFPNMKKLRWIELKSRCVSPWSTNSPPLELCCLILDGCVLRQLWKGHKYLPNLRMIHLSELTNLIETPDFNGLPNLEKFMVDRCSSLQEIHPSIGRLERLVSLIIRFCENLKIFPTITRSHNLKNFILSHCPKLFEVSEIEQSMDYLKDVECCLKEPPSLPRNTRLQFFNRALTKLSLYNCNLGDGDVNSVVWELSSLIELDIGANKFSRLNFSLWKLPRLKLLDVSWSLDLVELSGLPPSIAVLEARWCRSLENVADLSNCKWLGKVSFFGNHNLGPHGANKILDFMLQGNAIEDHFLSFTLAGYEIPQHFAHGLVKEKTFTLQLPQNWYIDFSGFLIYNANDYVYPCVSINIKLDQDKEPPSEVWHEATKPCLYLNTYVGYVSFNSLIRDTAWLNSEYNKILFSVGNKYGPSYEDECKFAAKLVPRKSKGVPVQITKLATDCSEYYNEEHQYGKTFTIQHHSESSIKILWVPHRG